MYSAQEKPAKLLYGDSDYKVLEYGHYVICAVSHKKIPLNALYYWNAERQEAYFDAAASLKRHLQMKQED